MVQRLASIDLTRRRIIDAARELVSGGGGKALTIQGVAELAEVSRPTIYQQFGSRRGLIEALVTDVEQRSGVAVAVRAALDPEPTQALVAWLNAAVRFWAAEKTVLGAAFALAKGDPEMRGVLEAHNAARRARAEQLVKRIEANGSLVPGLSQPDAVELLCLLSSYAVFDELSHGGTRSHAIVARLVGHLASEAVLA